MLMETVDKVAYRQKLLWTLKLNYWILKKSKNQKAIFQQLKD